MNWPATPPNGHTAWARVGPVGLVGAGGAGGKCLSSHLPKSPYLPYPPNLPYPPAWSALISLVSFVRDLCASPNSM